MSSDPQPEPVIILSNSAAKAWAEVSKHTAAWFDEKITKVADVEVRAQREHYKELFPAKTFSPRDFVVSKLKSSDPFLTFDKPGIVVQVDENARIRPAESLAGHVPVQVQVLYLCEEKFAATRWVSALEISVLDDHLVRNAFLFFDLYNRYTRKPPFEPGDMVVPGDLPQLRLTSYGDANRRTAYGFLRYERSLIASRSWKDPNAGDYYDCVVVVDDGDRCLEVRMQSWRLVRYDPKLHAPPSKKSSIPRDDDDYY